MAHFHDRNFGCRIRKFDFRGLRCVSMENPLLKVTILADKGTDIYEFLYKPTDTDFMWRSPFPLRDTARFVRTLPDGAGMFHDNYHGGWQEILPTGGVPTTYQGAGFGFHGEVSLIPWEAEIVQDTPQEIAVKFTTRTYRTPFYVEKILRMQVDRPVLLIEEQLENESDQDLELMWGHHPALGENFINPNCVVELAGARVDCQVLGGQNRCLPGEGYDWPIVPGVDGNPVDLRQIMPPETYSHDVAFLYDLKAPWAAIRDQKRGLGFGLRWSEDVFKALWFWQVYGGPPGYNFYKRGYLAALEPWSSYPSDFSKAREKGTALSLKARQVIKSHLLAVVFESSDPVRDISISGQVG